MHSCRPSNVFCVISFPLRHRDWPWVFFLGRCSCRIDHDLMQAANEVSTYLTLPRAEFTLWKMSVTNQQFFLNRLASTGKFLSAIRDLSCPALLLLGVVVMSIPASAQTGTLYRLSQDSSFQQGCFPPCLCPIMLAMPVKGTFVLTPTGFDGLFN